MWCELTFVTVLKDSEKYAFLRKIYFNLMFIFLMPPPLAKFYSNIFYRLSALGIMNYASTISIFYLLWCITQYANMLDVYWKAAKRCLFKNAITQLATIQTLRTEFVFVAPFTCVSNVFYASWNKTQLESLK